MSTNNKPVSYIDSLGEILEKLPMADVQKLDAILDMFMSRAVKQTIKAYINQHTTNK